MGKRCVNNIVIEGVVAEGPQMVRGGGPRLRFTLEYVAVDGAGREGPMRVDVWARGALAEKAEPFLFKGDRILVRGRLFSLDAADEGASSERLSVLASAIRLVGTPTAPSLA